MYEREMLFDFLLLRCLKLTIENHSFEIPELDISEGERWTYKDEEIYYDDISIQTHVIFSYNIINESQGDSNLMEGVMYYQVAELAEVEVEELAIFVNGYEIEVDEDMENELKELIQKQY